MKQGEIWYADLEPVKGSEQSGKRPVVIISGPAMNAALQNVNIVGDHYASEEYRRHLAKVYLKKALQAVT